MKCLVGILVAGLLTLAVGCTTGSQATFGPLHGESYVMTHLELQEPAFYFAEEKEKEDGTNLCTGSSLLFWSSEICVAWYECDEVSLDLYLNWEQEEKPIEPE